MKIRSGFVSNSSVSSFLVVVKDVVKRKKKSPMDFTYDEIHLFMDSYLNDCGEDSGIESDMERIFEKLNYGEVDKIEFEKTYKNLKKDEKIVLIEINTHIPMLKDIIRNCRDIQVLESWGD